MEQKLYFNNSKGNRLCGILSDVSSNKIKPVIILVHGFSSNKNTKNFLRLIDFLNKNNTSSFRFDIFGHGESEGKFEEITITEAVDDILKAVEFLKEKGYQKFGLVGSSFGGNASIIATPKIENLVFLVLKSPVSNYEERAKNFYSKKGIQDWMEKGYRLVEDDGKVYKLNYSYFADFKNADGYKVAHLIKVPTLIVHGDKDKSVPIEQSIKISKLIPNCKLVIIKGADHKYTKEEHSQQMNNAISEFIINHLIW